VGEAISRVVNLNAGPLFDLARVAYSQTQTALERQPGQTQALVAIVFACAALEGFINEIGALARSIAKPLPAEGNLGAVLEEIENSHGSLGLKFDMARIVVTGESYGHGESPDQDFARLVTVRNLLVHLKEDERAAKADDTYSGEPRVLAQLRSANLVADLPAQVAGAASVVVWLSTRAVARWACNSVSDMVYSMLDSLPPGELKRTAELFYRTSFAPVAVSEGDGPVDVHYRVDIDRTVNGEPAPTSLRGASAQGSMGASGTNTARLGPPLADG
jgi:hypothetical protein